MGGEKSRTHGLRRGRRDSGCYLSNENLNNNSSNSSTCEKKDPSATQLKLLPTESREQEVMVSNESDTISNHMSIEERLQRVMDKEKITLSCAPYTDEVIGYQKSVGWCVVLVSRYSLIHSAGAYFVAMPRIASIYIL